LRCLFSIIRAWRASGSPLPVGGFCIIDVPSRDDALAWAAKVAAGCRCAQEVRELIVDPAA
jgi:hypothetical protein